MINFKKLFKNIRQVGAKNVASQDEANDSISVNTFRKAQERRWLYVCLLILGVLGIAIKLQGGSSGKIKHEEKVSDEGRNIALSFDNDPAEWSFTKNPVLPPSTSPSETLSLLVPLKVPAP